MKSIPVCHWSSSSAVQIVPVTLPYFNGTLTGVGAATYCPSQGLYLIAVANGSPYAMTSPDGITWTQRTLPSTTTSWNNAASEGTRFLVATSASTVGCVSAANSVTSWSSVTMPGAVQKKNLTGHSGYFKCNPTNAGKYSTDGSTWTNGPGLAYPPNPNLQAAQVGDLSVSSYSATRYNQPWNLYTNFFTGTIIASTLIGFPAASSSLWAMFQISSGAAASSSPDGTTWTSRTLPIAQANTVTGGTNKHVFAFASSSATFIYSENGVTWKTGTLPSSAAWNACASDGTSMMVFSSSSLQAYKITVS